MIFYVTSCIYWDSGFALTIAVGQMLEIISGYSTSQVGQPGDLNQLTKLQEVYRYKIHMLATSGTFTRQVELGLQGESHTSNAAS